MKQISMPELEKILATIRIAETSLDKKGMGQACRAILLNERNRLARLIFKNPLNRKITIGIYEVETWWDRSSLNWISQLKDQDGNQIGDADITGNRDDAAVAHIWMIAEATKRMNKEFNSKEFQNKEI